MPGRLTASILAILEGVFGSREKFLIGKRKADYQIEKKFGAEDDPLTRCTFSGGPLGLPRRRCRIPLQANVKELLALRELIAQS